MIADGGIARTPTPSTQISDGDDLRRDDRPEQPGARIGRLEQRAFGADDKQKQMAADRELQEHHGLQLSVIELDHVLELRIGHPAQADQQQTESLRDDNRPMIDAKQKDARAYSSAPAAAAPERCRRRWS